MNSSGRQSRKSHHSAYLHGSCNLGIRHKTRNARHEPQRKAEVRLFVAERLPQCPQSTQYTLPLSNRVLLHITYIHLKMPQREGSCSIYGQQSWELYTQKKKKIGTKCILFSPLRATAPLQYHSIQLIHSHHCAFLLFNAAKCRALPKLFHETQPCGFDINGKYDCRLSALFSPSLPFFLFRNMYDRTGPLSDKAR